MRRSVLVTLAAGLALGLGCKKGDKVRLVSDAELAQLQAEHATKLQAHLAKSCERSVLRGPAPSGDGTAALLVFADAKSSPHAACLEAAGALDASELLFDCAEGMDRSRCPPRQLSDQPKKDEVAALLTTCASAMTAMQTAVSYGAVCSPFRPSKGPKDPALLGYVRATQVAALRARQLARDAEPAAGLDLTMDAARLTQDVDRPGASLISAMIAVASLRAPMGAAESILNSKVDWTSAELDAAVTQADLLRASQVPWDATMTGEGLYMLEEIARQIRGEAKALNEKPLLGPEDEYGVVWLAVRGWIQATEKACSGKSLKDCIEGTERARASDPLEADVAQQLGANPNAFGAELRERIVAILREVVDASTARYARRHATAVGQIIALRAHLEYARMTAAAKQCPEAHAATAALAPLLDSKELGSPLTTFVAPDGSIELRLPEWAVYNDKKTPNLERLTVWRVRCPA